MLTRSKITGRLGINYVERVALAAGCKPIAVPEDLDTGIDGFIEFGEAEGFTRLIAFQVKRGESYFDSKGAKCAADGRHLRYWTRYALPVVLIVIREDESESFWMDVREYVRDNPPAADQARSLLRLSGNQRFDVIALKGRIRELASPSDFGDAVSALTDAAVETRMSALSLLYRFRIERRSPFCLAAALRVERDSAAIATFCDFYSRYLTHPEISFGVDKDFSSYARSLLADLPPRQLLAILEAFNDDDHYGDWDGATEIFRMTDEEIWVRHDVIERGTVHQGIAEVLRAAVSPEQLLSVIADSSVPLRQRKSAVALFGYLGHTCTIERLDRISRAVSDPAFLALLKWLRHWIVAESESDERTGRV